MPTLFSKLTNTVATVGVEFGQTFMAVLAARTVILIGHVTLTGLKKHTFAHLKSVIT